MLIFGYVCLGKIILALQGIIEVAYGSTVLEITAGVGGRGGESILPLFLL